jgi:hypothetical protein
MLRRLSPSLASLSRISRISALNLVLCTSFSTANMASATGGEKAIIAGGCFWCIEASFHELKGVQSAISGYIGGSKANPTYEEVRRTSTQMRVEFCTVAPQFHVYRP